VVLHHVVPAAQVREVADRRPSAPGSVPGVIEIAPPDRLPAAHETAVPIAHPQRALDVFTRSVTVDREDGARHRMGQDAIPPRRVTGEPARCHRIDGRV